MVRDIAIIQLGVGGVGREVIRQVLTRNMFLSEQYGFQLRYLALVDSSGILSTGAFLADVDVARALAAKQSGTSLGSIAGGIPSSDWASLLPNTPAILVDVTAADGMHDRLIDVVGSGHRVVLANKRPVTTDFGAFTALTAGGATRYEATVGAGLPIISTMQALIDSGDKLVRIEAAMSGTLGYLCSALEEGEPLSQAVRTARTRGWTEPDPRDDLSGADVARKALILARTAGYAWTMDDVLAEPWFSPDLAEVSVNSFMERIADLDAQYAQMVQRASANNHVLRYVATIEPDGASVGLRELERDHPLAALRGTDNLFSFTTTRYATQPLVVRGPGAGVEVTAAGVLADMVATAREM